MTVGPGKTRLQITVPVQLREHLEEMGHAAGLSFREVALVYLSEGAARSRAQASLSEACGPKESEPIGHSTRKKSSPKSAARPASGGADDDIALTAEDVVELLPADELAALRLDGWTPKKIAQFMNEE